MRKHVEEFARRVDKEMLRADADRTTVHQTIELAYEQCIVAHEITKSFFLDNLASISEDIFTETVEHLFTPINWSKVKMRVLWGVRNEATGNLLTLERDSERDVYKLKEAGDDPAILCFAPMMTGNQEDAELFIKMLNQLPTDAPVGVGESIVTLDIEEGVNVKNLAAVEVKLIF